MSEKTITRQEFKAAVDEHDSVVLVAGRRGTEETLQRTFIAAGITVEPAPILPGVSGGEWEVRGPYN